MFPVKPDDPFKNLFQGVHPSIHGTHNLLELERQGTVETRKEGRKKIYTLTEAGHAGVMEACEYFFTVYGEMFKEYSEIKAEQAAPVS